MHSCVLITFSTKLKTRIPYIFPMSSIKTKPRTLFLAERFLVEQTSVVVAIIFHKARPIALCILHQLVTN